ncbi:MAG: hypothetical protein Kow0090_11140 [Myxococcota bacterium]
MKGLNSALVLFLTALLFAGCASSSASTKSGVESAPTTSATPLNIEVNDIVPKGIEESSASVITNKICSILSLRKRFTVRCSDDARAVMRMKANVQMLGSGDVDVEKIAQSETESQKKADRLIEGTLGKVGSKVVLSLKLTNPTTGEALNRQEVTVSEDAGKILPLLEDALAKLIP